MVVQVQVRFGRREGVLGEGEPPSPSPEKSGGVGSWVRTVATPGSRYIPPLTTPGNRSGEWFNPLPPPRARHRTKQETSRAGFGLPGKDRCRGKID